MSPSFTTVAATELPRDRWGRPLITPPTGGEPVAYQRVTTFVGALEDTYHLSVWKQTRVALGMARRRDLIGAVLAIADPNDRFQKKTLKNLTEQAFEAGAGTEAATRGTAFHSFAERIDKGEVLEHVPEEYEADIAAYSQVMTLFEILDIEGFCVVDHLRVGGSYDKILRFTAEGLAAWTERTGHVLKYPDGSLVQAGDVVLADIKTGGIDFGMGKIAMQLGTYVNAVKYEHTNGTRSPLPGDPSKKWAVVIHVPAGAGTASLVWVDVETGWNAAETIAPLVHAWRKVKGDDISKVFAVATVATTPAKTIAEQIREAPSADDLRVLYAMNKPAWTPGLTSLAEARIQELSASA